MKIGPEARNGLISLGVAGAGTAAGLLWLPLLLIPGGLGLVGVGWFGDRWWIHRKAAKGKK